MRFPSKVDGWVIPVFVIAVIGMLTAFVSVHVEPSPLWLRVTISFTSVVFCALVFSLLKGTFYVVENGQLRVHAGPFRWTISVADIDEITPTRNPLSSPALSLDRLKISYGKRRFVMVSPADKEGFLRAIENERGTQ